MHCYSYSLGIVACNPHRDRALLIAILDSVAHKVGQHLPQARVVR
jgi:hypothetical protein